MPSARVARHPKAGRPLWWVAGLVLCVAAGVAAYLVLASPNAAVLPRVGPLEQDGVATREDSAADLLERLTTALTEGSPTEAVKLAVPGDDSSRRELAQLARNARALDLTDLELRYVDENTAHQPIGVPKARLGDAWVADVQLRWRFDRFDRESSQMEVAMTFVQTKDGAALVSARSDYGEPAPLWMLGRVAVDRSNRALVVADKPSFAKRYARLANRAVADVHKVLPWRGQLVVEVPSSEGTLNRALGAQDGDYDAIAAVTTPADGSVGTGAPDHVFVNPDVFDPLGAQGSQIVMTHEATHVATDAPGSALPVWLLEGFADYVALAHVDLPVTVTASQILGEVRDSGPPRRLPSQSDFETHNTTLGSSYEAAWLACRLLAEEYGEQALIRFYRQADRAGGTGLPFVHLGTTQKAFTKQWRAYLRDLAA